MANDKEILKLWNGFSKQMKNEEAIISLYLHAENAGMVAMEKELIEDSTIESAIKVFGWGRKRRESIITLRAIMREAAHLAMEKAKK